MNYQNSSGFCVDQYRWLIPRFLIWKQNWISWIWFSPYTLQPPSLQDRFYLIWTSLPSCIQLLSIGDNNFELKPQFINTLSKYHGLESEDAYFFIREFEEVYQMIKLPNLVDNAIRLWFVPFSLKDLAKKWLYSLEAESIKSWGSFVKVFLKKFYPTHKTALIRKNITQWKQEPNKLFWKYFERFKDLLVQCPHHGLEQLRLCQILYNSLDYQNKTLFETMCGGKFLKKDENEWWKIYKDLGEKTLQWESTNEESRTANPISSKRGLHDRGLHSNWGKIR